MSPINKAIKISPTCLPRNQQQQTSIGRTPQQNSIGRWTHDRSPYPRPNHAGGAKQNPPRITRIEAGDQAPYPRRIWFDRAKRKVRTDPPTDLKRSGAFGDSRRRGIAAQRKGRSRGGRRGIRNLGLIYGRRRREVEKLGMYI